MSFTLIVGGIRKLRTKQQDRAFYIGQNKDVQAYKFVTLGNLEERIDEMIERKQGLSEQIIVTGENRVMQMSTDELRELFELRQDTLGK